MKKCGVRLLYSEDQETSTDHQSTRGDDYGDHVAERVDQSEIEEISNEEEEEQLKEIEEVNGRHCNCSFMSNNCFSFLFHMWSGGEGRN
ncbi:hypothetical protein ACOSP7_021777 [Xanthoceras sorbifolium]